MNKCILCGKQKPGMTICGQRLCKDCEHMLLGESAALRLGAKRRRLLRLYGSAAEKEHFSGQRGELSIFSGGGNRYTVIEKNQSEGSGASCREGPQG